MRMKHLSNFLRRSIDRLILRKIANSPISRKYFLRYFIKFDNLLYNISWEEKTVNITKQPGKKDERNTIYTVHAQMGLSLREKMISFDPYENFNINRILLLSIGLWPFQRTKLAQIQLIVFSFILITFVTFQLTTFVTTECTPDLIIKILSSTIFFFMYVVEYNYFWANGQTVKYLMERLQQICNELKDENELAIIKKYGNIGKIYTTVLLWICIGSIFGLFSLPIWQRILNVVVSTNESKTQRTTQIKTEYFVDSERYFYLILLHMDASCCLGTIVVIATGTMFITCIKHICGMFKIASYRIEQALSNEILRKLSFRNELRIRKKLIYAVDIHRKAMKYSEFLVLSFEGMFMFLIIFGVISLSLNLFRVFQIMSSNGNIEDFILHFIYILIIFLYMFLANVVGQEITDHNNHVFLTAYNVQWYIAPLHIQKMILFLLQRGNKAFNLHVGRIIVPSLENFTSLISVSISYFTFMYSTQQ